MKGFVVNIEKASKENNNFRKVLYTSKYSQLVVMSLLPNQDIGEEVHTDVDQFLRIEDGVGKAVLDGVEHDIAAEWSITVPAGTRHNIINTSPDKEMKLYTIYSPAHHKDGVMHATKEDAIVDTTDEFDGKTSE